jgi:hypothetical protein
MAAPPLPKCATYDAPQLPPGATYDAPQLPPGATYDAPDLPNPVEKWVGDRMTQAGKDFVEPFTTAWDTLGKDINRGVRLDREATEATRTSHFGTALGKNFKGTFNTGKTVADVGMLGMSPAAAVLNPFVAPIKRNTGVDMMQAVGLIAPEKAGIETAESAAASIARAPSALRGALSALEPTVRAAKRFVKANPKAEFLGRAADARGAGVEPSTVGVSSRSGLRLARTAKTVSPEAEASINEHAEVQRAQASQQAADRLQQDAPYGQEAPKESIARLSAEQDKLARDQFREPYATEVDAPDRVLELVAGSPEIKAQIKALTETEGERALHPEDYPNSPKQAQELRDLGSYAERKASWEAAKAKFDAEQAAYDAEVKKVGAESGKATKAYERTVERAKADHAKTMAQWEARKAAHTNKPFGPEDFTGKVKTNDLAFLNKADVLNAKAGSPTAKVRDTMFEIYGFKPRGEFAEPPPVLELPKAPKKVGDLKLPEHPGPPPSRPRVSGGALDRLRIGLRDKARALYQSEKPSEGGPINRHAEAIDAAMDGEGFEHLKGARETYREFEVRKKLLDIPGHSLLKSPGNFRVLVNKALGKSKMTPQMQADLTHALMSSMAEQAGKNPNVARQIALQFLRGGNFKKNIAPLLGAENTARIQTAMREVVGELSGLDYILGGSATADKQTDALRDTSEALWGVKHAATGNPLGALHSAAKIIGRKFATMSEPEAVEVATFFANGKSPEEVYAEIEALLSSNSIPTRAPPRIKAILGKAIGAQAAAHITNPSALQFNPNPTQPQK